MKMDTQGRALAGHSGEVRGDREALRRLDDEADKGRNKHTIYLGSTALTCKIQQETHQVRPLQFPLVFQALKPRSSDPTLQAKSADIRL
jgi:hypothetical protein